MTLFIDAMVITFPAPHRPSHAADEMSALQAFLKRNTDALRAPAPTFTDGNPAPPFER